MRLSQPQWSRRILLGIAISSGCGRGSSVAPVASSPAPAPEAAEEQLPVSPLDNYLNGLSRTTTAFAAPSDPVILPGTEHVGYTADQRCETATYRQEAAPTELAAFAPLADVLWPGSLILGRSIRDGVLTPITVKRRPLTLVITDVGLPDSGDQARWAPATARVSNPDYPKVVEAMQRLVLENVPAASPARVESTRRVFHSTEQAALLLGAKASWMTGKAAASLEKTRAHARSQAFIRLMQAYFNVSMAPVGMPSDLFAGVDTGELASKMGGDTTALAYVSTITYGRLLLIGIESDSAAATLEANLSVMAHFATSSGELNVSKSDSAVIASSTFHLFVLGGGTGGLDTLITADGLGVFPAVRQYWKEGRNFDSRHPGLPIAYQLRWVQNPFDNARLAFTTDYTPLANCAPQRLNAYAIRFRTTRDDKDNGDNVTVGLRLGNAQLSEAPGLFGLGTWRRNTDQPATGDGRFGRPGWFVFDLTHLGPGRPTVHDCPSLRFSIAKPGTKKWAFYWWGGVLREDGTFVNIADFSGAHSWLGGSNGQQAVLAAPNGC